MIDKVDQSGIFLCTRFINFMYHLFKQETHGPQCSPEKQFLAEHKLEQSIIIPYIRYFPCAFIFLYVRESIKVMKIITA